MKVHSPELITKQTTLKVVAVISAYLLWRIISNYHMTTITLQAPLSFYNRSHYSIHSPEAITLTLKGKKKSFVQIAETIAVHIDVSHLHEGENQVKVNSENLFLPEDVKLVRCNPYYFTLTLTKAKD